MRQAREAGFDVKISLISLDNGPAHSPPETRAG